MYHRALCSLTLCLCICVGQMLNAQLPEYAFRYIDYRSGLPDGFLPNAMIQDHSGFIWLGTNKGLFRYDGSEVINVVPNINDSTALSDLAVQALYVHSDSTIWMGTRNLGICIYYPGTGKFQRVLPVSEGGTFPTRMVRDFYQDRDGIMWISTEEGLVRHDISLKKFSQFRFSSPEVLELETKYLNTLREVSDDSINHELLWVCTRGGLLSFDKKHETFKRHRMPFTTEEVGLVDFDYMVKDLEWTSPYDMWFGSWAAGILHFDTRTQHWQRYRNPVGKPIYDIVYGLTPKSESEFWFGNQDKVGYFNHKTGDYTLFRNNAEVSGGVVPYGQFGPLLVTHNGILVIAFSYGLHLSLEPVTTLQSSGSILPLITAINFNHLPVSHEKAPGFIDHLDVEAGDHTITFNCAWPLYVEAARIEYRMQLSGYDRNWIYNGSSGKVQYTNLNPGKYKLIYEARKDGGPWVAGLTSPELNVRLPFFRSIWFKAGIGLLLISLISALYVMRRRQVRRVSKLKSNFSKMLAENELVALRAQMNPHFLFNSLNSINNFILKEHTTEASDYLTKFSQLMRAILKNSRHQLIVLEDEIYALTLYIEMEAMRFNHEFEYDIIIDPRISPSQLLIPPLLIQPYVENAIWHGLMRKNGHRSLILRFIPSDDYLRITVEDNGIGRTEAASHKLSENGNRKSYGMQITHDRIALINQTLGIHARVEIEDLHDANRTASGTRIILHLPMKYEESTSSFTDTYTS